VHHTDDAGQLKLSDTVGVETFLGLPAVLEADGFDEIGAAFLGIPHGVAYAVDDEQRALGDAPAAVRSASRAFVGKLGHYDFDLDGELLAGGSLRVGDLGDVATVLGDSAGNRQRAHDRLWPLVRAGVVPLIVGGDDSIPPMLAQALARRHAFDLVTIDAHLDFRDEVDGVREGRSSPARRISDLSSVQSITQIGLRGIGLSGTPERDSAIDRGHRIVRAADVYEHDATWLRDQLPTHGDVMLSIDCDGLDPSLAPGTGWPQPGGLSFRDVALIIEHLSGRCRIIGADIVELLPSRDVNGATALIACRLLMLIIGGLARRPRPEAAGLET
jgi:agmatinase